MDKKIINELMQKNQINELIELLLLFKTASKIEEPSVKQVITDGKNQTKEKYLIEKEDKNNSMMRGYKN